MADLDEKSLVIGGLLSDVKNIQTDMTEVKEELKTINKALSEFTTDRRIAVIMIGLVTGFVTLIGSWIINPIMAKFGWK